MDGGDRTVMAGGHRLQHVEDFCAADLADDDSVRAHAQTVLDQVALRDLAAAFKIRRPRLEPHDVGLLQGKLGRILDRNDSLVLGNERGQTIEHRGFARAGTAANDYVEARSNNREQKLDQVPGESVFFDQRADVEAMLAETPDR